MDFERLHRIRHVYVLGCYLKRGGTVSWRERRPGDGSGLGVNEIRFEITFDGPLYWRIWTEISERRGWGARPASWSAGWRGRVLADRRARRSAIR